MVVCLSAVKQGDKLTWPADRAQHVQWRLTNCFMPRTLRANVTFDGPFDQLVVQVMCCPAASCLCGQALAKLHVGCCARRAASSDCVLVPAGSRWAFNHELLVLECRCKVAVVPAKWRNTAASAGQDL